MLVHFVRHGESYANVQHVITNRGAGPGLTEQGRRQAQALACRLEGSKTARLLSSPLARARQTAKLLSSVLDVPAEVAPELREFDCGELEGRSNAEAWTEHMALVRGWLLDGYGERRIAGGESLLDVRNRFVPFVTAVCASTLPGQGDIVFVGHAGLYAAGLPYQISQIDRAFAWSHPIGKAGHVLCEWRDAGLRGLRWEAIVLGEGP